MRDKAIAFDCDDVLYRTAPSSVEWFNENYDLQLSLNDMYQKPTEETYQTDDPQGRVSEGVRSFLLDQGDKLPVIDGAQETIRGLAERGFLLYVVTGRSEEARQITELAVERDFPDCFQSVEMTDTLDASLRTSKEVVCSRIGAVAICDDQLVSTSSGSNLIRLVYGDYPWNRSVKNGKRVVKVCSMDELEVAIGNLS